MTDEPKIRFVLIGGFLGAGKTTLVGQLARAYAAAGKRVGIITNDQAENLVDTQNLRSQGFDVGEVAGACFCCSFDDLVATADRLSSEGAPDILLAEPVGSCTDLVATVVRPLQQLLGDRFELAPFGVLLKPSHGKRILAEPSADERSGFSPQAEYIFLKQLEEADYIMIGRRDQLSDDEVAALKSRLAIVAPGIPVVAVSPATGEGVDEVLGYIESPMEAGRRLLDIDYDTYADGEAELGWVNLTAQLDTDVTVDLDKIASDVVTRIRDVVVGQHDGHIAHLKTSVLAGDTQAVANVVANDAPVDVGLLASRSVAGSIQVIVNARVAMDPGLLEDVCREQVAASSQHHGITVTSISARSLRPGRPTPTHRVGT
ncbi:GTP-binding protein [Rubripirellula reticaptiva]|uniref:Putative GTP-binding protein YjiA n=1 Tax=Rubripirellula reticaptiva TaxID=2528013 RepID=A0A5C6EJA2_9BACT|nr:GTP-binding protein [Rubripirellula reticaptiva]TWU48167.1 putative GTP-binding protein YjiA [Rubripirellula reticaptiva]